MSYGVYKKFCKLLFEVEGDDYAFAQVFLKLEWNFFARSDNCLAMNINNVQW